MRLIDADELKMSVILPRCGAKAIVGYAIRKMIDSAPTVEAIPVEWILNNERMPKAGTGRKAIMDMIEDWRKENAAN